ncbi:MAG: type II secretion system protein [bacterium]|nr:type II secretion system protein [bacterium]
MKARGFTLIELLVAMALFGGILSLLLTSFFQFQGTGSRLESTLAARQELRNLEALIRQDLASAVYLPHYATAVDGQAPPSGIVGVNNQDEGQERDLVSMHVAARGRFYTGFRRALNPELFEVAYRFKRDAQGVLGFYRREGYYLGGPLDEGEEAIEHRLSTRLKSLDLKYYGQDNLALDSWNSNAEQPMPLGVMVVLGLEEAPGQVIESRFVLNLRPSMGPGVSWRDR